MDSESYLSLLVFIGVCILTAASGGIFRPGRWYESLAKPSWRPPNWLFGPVWAVLYGMIAVSGWLVWTEAPPGTVTVPMVIYGVQLVLNFLWSAIFFGLRRLGLALLEMAFLWLAIVATIVAFYPLHAGAAYMLLPYLAWVSFAFILNWAMWRLNPAPPRRA